MATKISDKEEDDEPLLASSPKRNDYYVLYDDDKEETITNQPPIIIGTPQASQGENDGASSTERIFDEIADNFNEEVERILEAVEQEYDPPPLELPPLEAFEEDSSFIQMVRRIANRYPRSTTEDRSFSSLVQFDDDDDSNQDEDDELQVENPRRSEFPNQAIPNENPLYVDYSVYFDVSSSALFPPSISKDPQKQQRQQQEEEFVMIQRNPGNVNDLRYVPVSEEPQQEEDDEESFVSTISRQSQLFSKYGLYKNSVSDENDNVVFESSIQQDYSSWLCFDSNDNFQNIKSAYDDSVSYEKKEGECSSKRLLKGKNVAESTDKEKEFYQLFEKDEDEDAEDRSFIERFLTQRYIRSNNAATGGEDESSFNIEKYIANMSTPKRGSARAAQTLLSRTAQSPTGTSELISTNDDDVVLLKEDRAFTRINPSTPSKSNNDENVAAASSNRSNNNNILSPAGFNYRVRSKPAAVVARRSPRRPMTIRDKKSILKPSPPSSKR